MRVPFGEYRPDLANIDSGFATVARNVIPGGDSYLPFRALADLAGAEALPGTPRGYILAQDSAGDFTILAACSDGSNDRIYSYSTGTWTDRSKTGGYAAADPESGWNFMQYGDNIIAVSGANNDVQVGDISNLAAGFDDMAGNGGTDPPRCKYVKVISEFVVLAGLTDYPTSIQWSGIGDCLEWRVGVDGADIQQFPDLGLVMGVTGSEYGLVFQQFGVRRMVFSPGSPYAFSFEKIPGAAGVTAPNGSISASGRHFWLGDNGFWMEAGGAVTPIGAERINRTFFDDIDITSMAYIRSEADPVRQIIYWSYPSLSQPDQTVSDKIIAYNYQLDRWTTIEASIAFLCQVVRTAQSIDSEPLASMALEDIPYSLDDPIWRGGRPTIGAFSTGNIIGSFAGDTLEATMETAVAQLAQPGRAMISAIAPMIDTSAARVNVATRHTIFGSDTWRTERGLSSFSGYARFEAQGRFHKIRVRIPAASTWSKAVGVEVDAKATGQ